MMYAQKREQIYGTQYPNHLAGPTPVILIDKDKNNNKNSNKNNKNDDNDHDDDGVCMVIIIELKNILTCTKEKAKRIFYHQMNQMVAVVIASIVVIVVPVVVNMMICKYLVHQVCQRVRRKVQTRDSGLAAKSGITAIKDTLGKTIIRFEGEITGQHKYLEDMKHMIGMQ